MSSSNRPHDRYLPPGSVVRFGRLQWTSGAERVPWLLLIVCSLGVTAPLFWHGPSCGHDFDFHLLSWLEAAHDWHRGWLDPQWLATANYGAGEPRFVFYPPASWIFGGLLGAVGTLLAGAQRGWTLAPEVFTFCCALSAGLCVFLLARRLASRSAATAAACLFVANPYLLFVAYERTAYGELLATPLMAILLLYSLREELPVVRLALVVGALWFTNAPAAVMGCYTLAFVCGFRLLRERHWLNAGKAIVATGLGLALAGCYLVPAVWQQRWVQISRAIGSGMQIEDSFLFRHTGQAYHDEVLHTASVIVVILFAATVIAMLPFFRRSRSGQSRELNIFLSLLAVILFLQFPASRWLWHTTPHLLFLQFPWRWMLVASIAAACVLAVAISQLRFETIRLRAVVYLSTFLIVGASIAGCSRWFIQACDEQDRVAGQLEAFRSGSGVEGTDEYTAVGADNSAILQDLPEVRLLTSPDAEEPAEHAGDNPEWDASKGKDEAAGAARVDTWRPDEKQIDIASRQQAFAVLRLMDYPAWDVLLNGRTVIGRLRREDGLMVIAIPAGSSHLLVKWKTTPDVMLGRELSAGSVVLLVILLIVRRRREHRKALLRT